MKLFKEFVKAFGIGVIIFLVFFLIVNLAGRSFGSTEAVFYSFLYTVLYSVILYFVNYMVFVTLDRIFGKGQMTAKRVATGFVASFVVTMFFIFLLRIFEDVVMEGKPFRQFLEEEVVSDYYFAMTTTLVILILIHSFYIYKRYQENKVKREKIIAGTASAKFETLKNQIDPHFLFNSLNVLSSLIEENPDSAQRFTTSLSKVYRYVLEQKDKELVSVEEELSFAKTYMNLLKMRFENSVFYELPAAVSNPDAKVVPLSLQLLLENTIKHNVVSQQRPLRIRIFEENGYLVVQNDLQKKEVLQDRRGVGLQNIVSRYAIITARKVQVEESENHFTVKLPILTKQVSIMEPSYNDLENSYYKAQKKVEDIKGFYGNLFSYIVVMLGLMILNLVTYPQYLWFLYPLVGWGIGVVIHGMSVFNFIPFLGSDWEEKKIRQILDKQKSSDKWK